MELLRRARQLGASSVSCACSSGAGTPTSATATTPSGGVPPGLELNGDGFEIETMMNIRARSAGLKVVEVASFEGRRVHGESRLRTIPDGWRVLRTILRERFFPGTGSRLCSRSEGRNIPPSPKETELAVDER